MKKFTFSIQPVKISCFKYYSKLELIEVDKREILDYNIAIIWSFSKYISILYCIICIGKYIKYNMELNKDNRKTKYKIIFLKTIYTKNAHLLK